MQNYYSPIPQSNTFAFNPQNDNYLSRLQRLNQMQNHFNSQYPQYANNYQNNQIIFVQGETGAKAYQIPNNTTVLLMSSEGNEFFIKTTDTSGFPTIKKFVFQEYQEKQNQAQAQYVTHNEFNNFKKELLSYYESNLQDGKPTNGGKKSNDGNNDKKFGKRNDTKTNGNESDEK